MATKLFADRAFIQINGFEVAYLKTANLRRNQNLQRADHMTRTRRSSGYKRGNMHVSLSMGLDIEELKAQIDLALADPTADIKVVFICGAERLTALGVAESDMEIQGSVGDAGKSINCEALDLVNENGDSVNVDIALE